MNIPRYTCYKQVSAFQIARIHAQEKGTADGTKADPRYIGGLLVAQKTEYVLTDSTGKFTAVVSDAFYSKHEPEIGGYFVRYDDNYESFSPAAAFEGGYKLNAVSEDGFKWATVIVWPFGMERDTSSYAFNTIHVANSPAMASIRKVRGISVSRVILRGGLQPEQVVEELSDAISNATRTRSKRVGADVIWEVQP